MEKNNSPVLVIYHSGIILSKLQSVKDCSFSELLKSTSLDIEDFYIAISYLLNEGKIEFIKKGNSITVRISVEYKQGKA